MAISASRRRVGTGRLAALAAELLDASALCAIATVDARGRAHANTAYFAWSRDYELVWLSEPRAQHSRNLAANSSASIAVFDSTQRWGEPDRGIQLFGRAAVTAGAAAESAARLYSARFPRSTQEGAVAYRLYVFRAQRLKLFDENVLGPGTFVTARIDRTRRPAWEKTEIYESDG